MKRIIALLTAFFVIFALPLHANAATADRTQYFLLTPGNERLSNDGKFTFELYSNVRSDHNFKPISGSISLEASAQVYTDDPYAESPRNADNVFFTIYLYRVGYDKPVGQFKHAANGTIGSTTFGVSTGVEYYFTIEQSGSLGAWETVKGNGDFSNIYIVSA